MTYDDDATRKIQRPRPEPPAPLPGPLDLTQRFERPEDADEPYDQGAPSELGWPPEDHAPDAPATEVLQPEVGLDQLFDPTPAAPLAAATTEAPTWTAMPVVPVRSEPLTEARPAPPRSQQPQMSSRVRSDAVAAWQGGVERVQTWLRSADNAVLLMTAVVGIVLIAVVAALGH